MRLHVLTGFLALAGFSLAMTATSNAGELLHPHRRAGCSSCKVHWIERVRLIFRSCSP